MLPGQTDINSLLVVLFLIDSMLCHIDHEKQSRQVLKMQSKTQCGDLSLAEWTHHSTLSFSSDNLFWGKELMCSVECHFCIAQLLFTQHYRALLGFRFSLLLCRLSCLYLCVRNLLLVCCIFMVFSLRHFVLLHLSFGSLLSFYWSISATKTTKAHTHAPFIAEPSLSLGSHVVSQTRISL